MCQCCAASSLAAQIRKFLEVSAWVSEGLGTQELFQCTQTNHPVLPVHEISQLQPSPEGACPAITEHTSDTTFIPKQVLTMGIRLC